MVKLFFRPTEDGGGHAITGSPAVQDSSTSQTSIQPRLAVDTGNDDSPVGDG